jgi:hypothetical protein
MGCYFSIVQFVPDSIGYDRYAIGVVAIDLDGTKAASAFLSDWSRAESFGANPSDFLREFAADLAGRDDLTVAELHEMSADYQNLIRVTEPDYADADAVEWVRDFGPLMVRDLAA